MNSKILDKAREVADLVRQRDDIDRKLAELMDTEKAAEANRSTKLPEGVTITEEVLKVFQDLKRPLRSTDVKKEIDRRFQINYPRLSIQYTIHYLVKPKRLLRKAEGYGAYELAK